jgi:uncharacterized protein (UPF0261 family)
MAVYVIATLDTKGEEAAYVVSLLEREGVEVVLMDTGCLGEPRGRAQISRERVFEAAGASLAAMRARGDRGEAVTAAARGAAELVRRAHAKGRVGGVLGLGGGAGTTIGTAAMRALPIGVPKLMVSTLASGQVAHFVGEKDVAMLNAVVDVAGLNRISRAVLARAAQAMAGMVRGRLPAQEGDRPLVGASMFGVTTPCVTHARVLLEAKGYEVLVFHATGSGGRTLESLAGEGLLAGVLDVTTTELADELVGGFLTAGPERLTAAGRAGVPQVVSVGALDMVNFHGPDSVPERFRGRKLYRHNENVTLMRTTPDECRALGREIGRKLAAAAGPAEIVFPGRGVSAYDAPGEPFFDPQARAALLHGLHETRSHVPLLELDLHVNDPEFGCTAAERLLALMQVAAAALARPTPRPASPR